jgi:hypothetical protein
VRPTRARIVALRQELLGLEDGAGNSLDADVNALCDLALESLDGWVAVPRELLENYAREYGKCPDLMLRAKYRKELFALLSPPDGPK